MESTWKVTGIETCKNKYTIFYKFGFLGSTPSYIEFAFTFSFFPRRKGRSREKEEVVFFYIQIFSTLL